MLNNSSILLRAVEPEDLDLMYLWENDRAVWHVSNTLEPYSRHSLQRYIESKTDNIFASQQLRMMIDCREPARSGITAGCIDLFDIDPLHRRAGLGILIAACRDRRRGYALDAIIEMINYCRSILFLHQIYCNIADTNTASINLFKKAGFTLAGIKKDWLRTEKGWTDELFMQYIIH